MLILREPRLEKIYPCGYLENRPARFKSFDAIHLEEKELEIILAHGWRKFGSYYFRPVCPGCQECIPLRILTYEFAPSKSQRRLLKKNSSTEIRFKPLSCDEKIFDIYRDHSLQRFGRQVSWPEFVANFYTPSCPALQSEYYVEGTLAAVGFLDKSCDGLSSVYFVYRSQYQHLGLGNYSILKEVEYAASLGLRYYYLGYYIEPCPTMVYKGQFYPNEVYNWEEQKWHRQEATQYYETSNHHEEERHDLGHTS